MRGRGHGVREASSRGKPASSHVGAMSRARSSRAASRHLARAGGPEPRLPHRPGQLKQVPDSPQCCHGPRSGRRCATGTGISCQPKRHHTLSGGPMPGTPCFARKADPIPPQPPLPPAPKGSPFTSGRELSSLGRVPWEDVCSRRPDLAQARC